MRRLNHFPLQLLLAGVLGLMLPLAAYPSLAATHSKFTGIYRSLTGKSEPSMSLSLGADGTATVTQDTGRGTDTFFGQWAESGEQVTVTFAPQEAKAAPAPMVFAPSHEGLQAVTWDHSAWGKLTPPPMKKGYKTKQIYWFTEVP